MNPGGAEKQLELIAKTVKCQTANIFQHLIPNQQEQQQRRGVQWSGKSSRGSFESLLYHTIDFFAVLILSRIGQLIHLHAKFVRLKIVEKRSFSSIWRKTSSILGVNKKPKVCQPPDNIKSLKFILRQLLLLLLLFVSRISLLFPICYLLLIRRNRDYLAVEKSEVSSCCPREMHHVTWLWPDL